MSTRKESYERYVRDSSGGREEEEERERRG